MSTMQCYRGPALVELKTPPHGYSVLLKMAWETKPSFDGSPISWDNGIANDTRICNIQKWHMNAEKQAAFNELVAYSRGSYFSIYLGDSSTGFFPAGPDCGDIGSFDVYAVDNKPSGVLRAPWLHFNNAFSLVIKNRPAYTLPARSNQGSFFFTTIGLHQPQSEIQVEKVSRLTGGELPGGNGYFVDNGTKAEYYISTVKLQANTANTAAVLDVIQNQIRNLNFHITCPKNVYLFGRDNVGTGATTDYTCRLLSNEIEVISERFNKFTFELKLLLVNYV